MGDNVQFQEQFNELKHQIASLQGQKVLEQRSFPWDAFILVIATTIAGLSISDLVVEFLRPDSSKVVCFVPELNNRDQVQYVNEFCHHALPFSVNLTIALFIQGLLLVAFHVAWKIIVRARIDSYFSHVATMETLRERRTGNYPDNNFDIVEYLQRQFGGKKFIVHFYLLKLVIQGLVIITAIVVNAIVFKDYDITFECEDYRDSQDSLFENVTCSYSKFQYLSFLSIVDYCLLGLSLLVYVWAFYICLFKANVDLGHKCIAEFSYQSGIDGEFYSTSVWPLYRGHRFLPIYDDMNILLSMLFSTNAGLGKLFKNVQIESDISDLFNSHLEIPIEEAAKIAKKGKQVTNANIKRSSTPSSRAQSNSPPNQGKHAKPPNTSVEYALEIQSSYAIYNQQFFISVLCV